VKAIHTLRSGTTYDDLPMPSEEEVVVKDKDEVEQPRGKEPIL
jgi:hypothetical protein